jgi:hypothetical protein
MAALARMPGAGSPVWQGGGMVTGSVHRELTIEHVANGRFGVIRSRGGRISCTGLSPSVATRTEPSIATRTE